MGYSRIMINISAKEFDFGWKICITRKYIIIYELYLLFIVFFLIIQLVCCLNVTK